jgi:hypothetical protein
MNFLQTLFYSPVAAIFIGLVPLAIMWSIIARAELLPRCLLSIAWLLRAETDSRINPGGTPLAVSPSAGFSPTLYQTQPSTVGYALGSYGLGVAMHWKPRLMRPSQITCSARPVYRSILRHPVTIQIVKIHKKTA